MINDLCDKYGKILKIGDRVKINYEALDSNTYNLTGKVIFFYFLSMPNILVEIDKLPENKLKYFHDGKEYFNFKGKKGHCYYFYSSCLIKMSLLPNKIKKLKKLLLLKEK